MQRNHTFPILNGLRSGKIAIDPPIDVRAASESAMMTISAIDSFSLWDVKNIEEFLDNGASTMTWDDMYNMPCSPPFSRIWFERVWDGSKQRLGVSVFFSSKTGHCEMHPFWNDADAPIYFGLLSVHKFAENGCLIPGSSGIAAPHGRDPKMEELLLPILKASAMTALTAFAFSHCKNVDLVERLPKRHEQREAKRKGEPILKYHEIVIDPNRSYADSESVKKSINQPIRALHLVRGHFATYSEEKPLFGKHAGTFFIQPHVRGRAENGVVKSTYKVKALNQ